MDRNEMEDHRPRLGWFPRLGMNLLAFFADSGGGGYGGEPTGDCPKGYSGGGPIGDDRCCGLATDKECCYPDGKSKAQYICPQGWYKTWWFCVEGTQAYGCGECSSEPGSCFDGDYECSIYWKVEPC